MDRTKLLNFIEDKFNSKDDAVCHLLVLNEDFDCF